MAQGSERRLVSRHAGNRLSNWEENVDEIGLIEANLSPASHAEQGQMLQKLFLP